MKKHLFYIVKSLFLTISVSLIVLSEYGTPFKQRTGKNYINQGKLWEAKPIMNDAYPIVLKHKKNSKGAVLIAHDYTGTTRNVKKLAEILFKEKYDVYVPLLPGHGTNIEDFNKTTLQDWANCLKEAYNSIKSKYNKIIGIGVYTGGSIFMKQIIEKTINFSALILINSPVMILGYTRGNFFLPDIRLFFSGILRHFITEYPLKKLSEDEFDSTPWQGYNGYANLSHLHFLKIILRKVKKHCFKINIPMFLIYNQNTKVPVENANYIYEHVKSDFKEKLIMHNHKNLVTDNIYIQIHKDYKDKLFNQIISFLSKIETKIKKEKS